MNIAVQFLDFDNFLYISPQEVRQVKDNLKIERI